MRKEGIPDISDPEAFTAYIELEQQKGYMQAASLSEPRSEFLQLNRTVREDVITRIGRDGQLRIVPSNRKKHQQVFIQVPHEGNRSYHAGYLQRFFELTEQYDFDMEYLGAQAGLVDVLSTTVGVNGFRRGITGQSPEVSTKSQKAIVAESKELDRAGWLLGAVAHDIRLALEEGRAPYIRSTDEFPKTNDEFRVWSTVKKGLPFAYTRVEKDGKRSAHREELRLRQQAVVEGVMNEYLHGLPDLRPALDSIFGSSDLANIPNVFNGFRFAILDKIPPPSEDEQVKMWCNRAQLMLTEWKTKQQAIQDEKAQRIAKIQADEEDHLRAIRGSIGQYRSGSNEGDSSRNLGDFWSER